MELQETRKCHGFGHFLLLALVSMALGLDNGSLSTALSPDRVANPDLTWETTNQINFGLDFGLFNQRVIRDHRFL